MCASSLLFFSGGVELNEFPPNRLTFITLDAGFQPSESGSQIVLSSVKNQKGRMFLGHGNALEESWDFTSGPVRFLHFSSQ